DPAMMLAVRVARTLKRATEAEMRLPRIANRPAAVVALKIDELFRLIASDVSGHDLARARGPTAASWCDRWEVVDVPAEGGIIGTPAAWRTPKRKGGTRDGRRSRLHNVPLVALGDAAPLRPICSSRIPRTFWKRH